MLRASGAEPAGRRSRRVAVRHPGLHPHDVLLPGLRARYDERALEWLPYLSRWLGGPTSESLEQSLIDAELIPGDRLPLGGHQDIDDALLGAVAVVLAELAP